MSVIEKTSPLTRVTVISFVSFGQLNFFQSIIVSNWPASDKIFNDSHLLRITTFWMCFPQKMNLT